MPHDFYGVFLKNQRDKSTWNMTYSGMTLMDVLWPMCI